MRIPILRPIGTNGEQHFTFEMLESALAKAEGDELELYISSPGGDVVTAHLMYSLLAEKKKQYKNITAIIASEASSAASYLCQIADSIKAFPHTSMVIHEARFGGITGDLTAGSLEKQVADLKKTNEQLAGIYSQRSGKPVDYWLEVMAKDERINAPELLEMGLVDEIIETKRAAAMAAEVDNHLTKSIINMDALENLQKTVGGLYNIVRLALGGKAKNMVIELADGTRLFVYSEDGELEGKQAVLVDSEGNPTEDNAPVGTHDLQDGRKIVVGEGGIIEGVEESELAKAIARAEAAEKKIEEMEAKVNAANEAVANATAQVEALARKVITAAPAPVRTAEAKAEPSNDDDFSPLAAVAKAKGMTIAQAEKWYNNQKKTK